MNVIVPLEFKLTYYNIAVQHINQNKFSNLNCFDYKLIQIWQNKVCYWMDSIDISVIIDTTPIQWKGIFSFLQITFIFQARICLELDSLLLREHQFDLCK